MSGSGEQLVLYLPVLHAGYERLLERHGDAEVLLLGKGFHELFPALRKDIRALDPARAAAYLGGPPRVRVVEPADLPDAFSDDLVMPDEEIMRELAAKYGRAPRFERTFLRWDRPWSLAEAPVDAAMRITEDELDRHFVREARAQAERSSDWWRQVGAVAVKDGKVLAEAYNRHHPSEYSPYVDGDPRNEFRRGLRADLSTAIHAEAAVVAEAAREGFSLRGADLYVTTFPCPACARLVAETGFRRLYFTGTYSVLDGEGILKAAQVEPIWVDPGEQTESR